MTRRRIKARLLRALAACSAAALSAPASAQDRLVSPLPHPAQDDPAAEQRLRQLDRQSRSFATADPGQSVARDASPSTALPEGASLVEHRGRLGGDAARPVFYPDPDASGASLPPMRLLPSRALASMLDAMRTDPEGDGVLTFRVSGLVTAHHGRNYLLPTFATRVRITDEDAPGPDPALAEPSPEAPPPDPRDEPDPSVGSLLEQLERATAAERTAPIGRTLETRADEDLRTVFLTDRAARLVRDGRGRLALDFTGARRDLAPPSAVLLPSQTLESLESLYAISGSDASLRVSGQAIAYAGAWYFLPAFARIEAPERLGLRPAGTIATHAR